MRILFHHAAQAPDMRCTAARYESAFISCFISGFPPTRRQPADVNEFCYASRQERHFKLPHLIEIG